MPAPICLRLLTHFAVFALAGSPLMAGKSRVARIAMMAMTTRSSTSVNPHREQADSMDATLRLEEMTCTIW
jgi:hypothetical protein